MVIVRFFKASNDSKQSLCEHYLVFWSESNLLQLNIVDSRIGKGRHIFF